MGSFFKSPRLLSSHLLTVALAVPMLVACKGWFGSAEDQSELGPKRPPAENAYYAALAAKAQSPQTPLAGIGGPTSMPAPYSAGLPSTPYQSSALPTGPITPSFPPVGVAPAAPTSPYAAPVVPSNIPTNNSYTSPISPMYPPVPAATAPKAAAQTPTLTTPPQNSARSVAPFPGDVPPPPEFLPYLKPTPANKPPVSGVTTPAPSSNKKPVALKTISASKPLPWANTSSLITPATTTSAAQKQVHAKNTVTPPNSNEGNTTLPPRLRNAANQAAMENTQVRTEEPFWKRIFSGNNANDTNNTLESGASAVAPVSITPPSLPVKNTDNDTLPVAKKNWAEPTATNSAPLPWKAPAAPVATKPIPLPAKLPSGTTKPEPVIPSPITETENSGKFTESRYPSLSSVPEKPAAFSKKEEMRKDLDTLLQESHNQNPVVNTIPSHVPIQDKAPDNLILPIPAAPAAPTSLKEKPTETVLPAKPVLPAKTIKEEKALPPPAIPAPVLPTLEKKEAAPKKEESSLSIPPAPVAATFSAPALPSTLPREGTSRYTGLRPNPVPIADNADSDDETDGSVRRYR